MNPNADVQRSDQLLAFLKDAHITATHDQCLALLQEGCFQTLAVWDAQAVSGLLRLLRSPYKGAVCQQVEEINIGFAAGLANSPEMVELLRLLFPSPNVTTLKITAQPKTPADVLGDHRTDFMNAIDALAGQENVTLVTLQNLGDIDVHILSHHVQLELVQTIPYVIKGKHAAFVTSLHLDHNYQHVLNACVNVEFDYLKTLSVMYAPPPAPFQSYRPLRDALLRLQGLDNVFVYFAKGTKVKEHELSQFLKPFSNLYDGVDLELNAAPMGLLDSATLDLFAKAIVVLNGVRSFGLTVHGPRSAIEQNFRKNAPRHAVIRRLHVVDSEENNVHRRLTWYGFYGMTHKRWREYCECCDPPQRWIG